MHVTWDPEDGSEQQTWVFTPEDITRKQGEKIEKHAGTTFDQWTIGLRTGDLTARAVLLWHMLTQVHPTLRFEDVPDFRVRQLKVQMDVAELKDLWEKAKKTRMKPDVREAFESQFETDMADALAREGKNTEVAVVDSKLEIEGEVTTAPKTV